AAQSEPVSAEDQLTAPIPQATAPKEERVRDAEHLLIDELSERLDTLRLFNESDELNADEILERFGSQGPVEDNMLHELSGTAPLKHPDRFEEAHRRAMRALEVFDRNATKLPGKLRTFKFLRPLAARVVQILITVVVRSHQKRTINSMRALYAMREANAVVSSPEHSMLQNARNQMDVLIPDLTKPTNSLPTFLAGGALISGSFSMIQRGLHDEAGRAVIAVGFVIIALASFWSVLRAAAIARRRTRISLDATLTALWETIGDAGSPPKDQSRLFATGAAVLLVVVWIVIPVAIAMIVTLKP
ncbi:MAG: hypothetical protein ABIR57_14300, partial [Aeromicrobium sp.]